MKLKVNKKRKIVEQVDIEVENLQFNFSKDKIFDKVKCYACLKPLGQERPFGIGWFTGDKRSGRVCAKCVSTIDTPIDANDRPSEEDLTAFLNDPMVTII